MAKQIYIFTFFLLAILGYKILWPLGSPYLERLLNVVFDNSIITIIVLPAMSMIALNTFLTVVEYLESWDFSKIRVTFFKGAILWFTFFVISYPATSLLLFLVPKIGIDPILDLSSVNLFGLEVLIYFVFVDFFYYWFHRSQHHFNFLWCFHIFHHSIRNLNAANSYHHWTEQFLRLFVFSIPVTILFRPSAESFIVFTAFAASWNQYIHCDCKNAALPNLLRQFIADNVYHHAHHGLEEKYHNKNYSAYFPVWDLVFGSQFMPETNELPATGLPGYDEVSIPGYFSLKLPKVKSKTST